jgi:glycosyltransferase involved in cell wall biosynthesis
MSGSLDHIRKLAEEQITPDERRKAGQVLRERKVAVFIVAYNAERHLEKLVDRIPHELMSQFAEIFVIDDSSLDATYDVANKVVEAHKDCNIKVYRTPFNRGYGGNQKLGYLYCIENGYDVVILLHGDGQYAPEFIPRLLAPFADGEPEAVFASRMLSKRLALQGGMPVYKWIGNQVLTAFENRMLGIHLSEFHTGFRAYQVEALQKIPYIYNSDDFHFDTEIIVQAVASGWKITEVKIPTYYGDEQCHVNGMRYAYNCAKAVLNYQLVKLGLYYQRNYDFGLFDRDNYQFKKSENSLHQFVINHLPLTADAKSIELGANRGILSSHIAPRVKHHIAVDVFKPDLAGESEPMSLNLNQEFSSNFAPSQFDCCVALDVIEHMDEPEHFLTEVFQLLKVNGKLFVSTANICYFPVRMSLLFGQFNYGKRGILDRTHKRLFSVSSFKKLISQYGFRVEEVRGFAPPLTDLIGKNVFLRMTERVHSFLSRVFPNLFAYNFLVIATRMDGIADVFNQTIHSVQSVKKVAGD